MEYEQLLIRYYREQKVGRSKIHVDIVNEVADYAWAS